MSAKTQHNNILLAIFGFVAVVIIVALIGFFTLGRDPEVMQGQVEVSEYRVSSKVPGRILEIRVKEGDYVKKGDTLGGIAKKYGTTVSAICKLNGISEKKVLQIGQKLIVR